MTRNTPKHVTDSQNKQSTRKKRGKNVMPATKLIWVLRLCAVQLPVVIAIVFSQTMVYFQSVSSAYDVIVIVLLGAVVATALSGGLRHAVVGAIIAVLYNLYLIGDATGMFWLSFETLQRGIVIAIAFPLLAMIMGMLKDRNDALLAREKTARNAAEETAQQLRFIAESMPQKIFTIKPNGQAEYANPQWAEYMGDMANRKPDEEKWWLRVHPDDAAENKVLWRRSLKTGEPFQFEHRLQRTDGTYVWHLTRAHALHGPSGKIVSWVGSSTDIEDVRRTRKLEATTARLTKQRAELVALNLAKDEFISLASHQLRTPATGVKQYVGMVLEGYGGKLSAKMRGLLKKAHESNERQLSVINDLLQVAQVDAGQVVLRKEPVDAGKLISDVIQEQQAKCKSRRQTVQFRQPKVKIIVTADPIKLRMVIENIIDNASKYTPDGKKISIRLSRSRTAARLAFKDEGVGIASHDTDKVFQKFLRLDNPMSTEVGGNGLGLYWVQKIIDLHGGHIAITSKVGQGTTFTVSLPLSKKRR